jgi:hypothetical protein
VYASLAGEEKKKTAREGFVLTAEIAACCTPGSVAASATAFCTACV